MAQTAFDNNVENPNRMIVADIDSIRGGSTATEAGAQQVRVTNIDDE